MNQRPRRNPVLLGAAAVLVTALCCAAPVLIAGGALAAVCGLLENPWVIGAAVALLLAAVVAFARRGQRGDHCCPADSHSPATHTLDDLTLVGELALPHSSAPDRLLPLSIYARWTAR